MVLQKRERESKEVSNPIEDKGGKGGCENICIYIKGEREKGEKE